MQQNATGEKLSPIQVKAIECLLSSSSVASAAERAGVNRSTLYRWMKEPAFRQALKNAEATALGELSRSLVALSKGAVAALAAALGGTEKASTRLRASEVVIANLLRLQELVAIEQRVSDLERKVDYETVPLDGPM